jgi:6-phosphogluconolactonase
MAFQILLRRGILAAAVALLVAVALADGVPTAAPGATSPVPLSKQDSLLRVYVGTYTSGASRGIYKVEMDASTGAVVEGPALACHSKNPSFLAVHPNGRFLYAVNETGNFGGRPTGAVSAFAVDRESGALSLLNQQPSEGADPCHLAVDAESRSVVVANYSGGSVAALPLGADGRLQPAVRVRHLSGSGPNAARQQSPHAHGVFFDPSKKFLLTADLGADRIHVERWDGAAGALQPNDPGAIALEPGSGPRHLAWHPSGTTLYVLNELFSTVSALHWNAASGSLSSFQRISALPAGFSGDNKAAEIAVSPDGRFLYASNRGDDALTVFTVDASGRLAPAGRVPTGGHAPRSFALDPAGRWLVAANQDSGSVVVFRVDTATGLPRRVGEAIAVPEPVCVVFAPRPGPPAGEPSR